MSPLSFPLYAVALRRARIVSIALVALAACSSGGADSPTTPTPPSTPTAPTIATALLPTRVTLQQGGTIPVAVTITRSAGFTAPLTITVDGLPAGVTAAVSNVVTAVGATTATITLTATATAPATSATPTVRAAGTGVADATAPLTLLVTPAVTGAYTLSATSAAVVQGSTVQAIVTITRTGSFAGNVALAVEGAPAGLATTLTPVNTTGTGSVLSIVAAATLAPGTYTLTLRGTTPGLADRTTTLTVTVLAPTGTGNVRLDFSGCGSSRPVWIAYQDGSGPWKRVTGTNDVFTFTLSAPVGGFAWVTTSGSSTALQVRHLTRSEASAAPIVFCPALPLGTKIVTGTVVGVAGAQSVAISLGGAFTSALALAPTFVLPGIPGGAHDLVAYRQGSPPSTADRVIVRRDADPTNGTALAPLDFGGAEAFAPATATIALGGVAANEGMSHTMSYLTGAACDASLLYTTTPLAATHAAFGIPAAQQRATDYHRLRLDVATATTSRSVTESFRTLAARTVALGAPLGAPTLTTLAGTYLRVQAALTVPAEYGAGASLYYIKTTGAPQSVTVSATPGYVGGTAATLVTPDLSAVTGWSDAWAPPPGSAVRWTITATGGSGATTACAEGARTITASVQGQR